jgi:hypothetical protein
MTKTYLISVSGMGFLAKRTRILPFLQMREEKRNAHSWQKLTHVLSFLVKKRIFLEGGFNFVNIGPK